MLEKSMSLGKNRGKQLLSLYLEETLVDHQINPSSNAMTCGSYKISESELLYLINFVSGFITGHALSECYDLSNWNFIRQILT